MAVLKVTLAWNKRITRFAIHVLHNDRFCFRGFRVLGF